MDNLQQQGRGSIRSIQVCQDTGQKLVRDSSVKTDLFVLGQQNQIQQLIREFEGNTPECNLDMLLNLQKQLNSFRSSFNFLQKNESENQNCLLEKLNLEGKVD